MPFLYKKDNAKSTVADNPLSDVATTINVAAGTGAKFPTTANGNWVATLWNSIAYPDPSDDPDMEEVLVTARTTDALTVTRGYNGTTAKEHALGSAIALLILAKHFSDIEAAIPVVPTHVIAEVPSGSINGSNQSFTLAHTPTSGTLAVYLNGQRLTYTNDYTLSGTTISMVIAPFTGDTLIVDYIY